MVVAKYELIQLRQLLKELGVFKEQSMKLVYDNQVALHIALNPMIHERTKHNEIDCHFVREKLQYEEVSTAFFNSNEQIADVFTKTL